MATPSKDDVLSFDVLVNIRDSLKAMEKFSRSMKKSMKEIAASGQKMGKQGAKTAKEGKDATDDWGDSVEKLNEAYEYHDKLLKGRGDTLRELRALYARSDKEARKNLATQIDFLEKNYKLQLKAAKVAKTSRLKGGLGARMFAPGLKKAIADIRGPGGMKQALEDAGEKLREPLESFLRKDAQGLAEKAARGFTGAVARGFHGGRLFARVGSRTMKNRGERAIMAGKAAGGVKGALQQAGGGGMKAIGELLGGIGKIMRPLATLGPLLQASLVGLVKLFIDLDAEVREFNKGIMESTSNLEFMGRAGNSVEAAAMNMRDALDGARRAATDASFNNALGITKDMHTAILNTLTQEGVAFGRLTDDAGNTAEGMKEVTQSIVRMGVAYSRGLGVPLQEITSLQAEMMVEMGKSVDDTRQSFAMMTSAAAESGMAGNKFFNVIRSLSTDLGLFNLRLEDSVALLGRIGKVMSPRSAQKFMQEATQGMKSMGRQEKLKMSLFVGAGNTKQIVDRDIDRKTDALIDKIAKPGEDKAALKKEFASKGYAAVKDRISGLGPESGALAESAIDLELQRSQAKKGQYGAAMATADLGIGGALEMKQRALTTFSKGQFKSITDALGSMDLDTVADNLGMSDEQVKQFAKLEVAINAERDAIRDELKAQGKDTSQVAKMGYDEVVAHMTDSMKKSLGVDQDGRSMEEKMYGLAAEQGQMTQSIQDKLANFVDWVMNALYDLLMDIYDAIMSMPFVGGGTKGKRDILKSGNGELIRAFNQALDKDGKLNFGALKGKMAGEGGGLGKNLGKLSATQEGRKKIAASVQSNLSGHDILGMARASGLDPQKTAELAKKLEKVAAVIVDPMSGATTQIAGPAAKGQVGDLMKIFEELKLTADEQRDLLAKAGWGASDVESLTGLVKDLGTTGGGGTVPGTPAKDAADAATTSSEQLTAVAEDTRKTQGVLKQQGIKIAPTTLKEEAKGMEASMLSALRTALFEYYMYSGTDRGMMLTAMREGGATPGNVGQRFVGGALQTGSTLGAVDELRKPLVAQGNAVGGLVTGVAQGMAIVAAQGEGLASVGKGERIVPAGGGGTGSGVNVVVNGIGGPDLARLIEGKVVEGIREYRRREKFT